MKIKLIMLVGLFALGLAFSATAGSVVDGDSDSVPDSFDNCSGLANGPADGSNQVDSDQDGGITDSDTRALGSIWRHEDVNSKVPATRGTRTSTRYRTLEKHLHRLHPGCGS